jgi:hypothetical protein
MLPKIIITILAATDLITTYIVEQNGGIELNPFPELIGFWGTVIMRITVLIFIIAVVDWYIKLQSKYDRTALIGIPILYCGVSIWWLAATLNNLLVIIH